MYMSFCPNPHPRIPTHPYFPNVPQVFPTIFFLLLAFGGASPKPWEEFNRVSWFLLYVR